MADNSDKDLEPGEPEPALQDSEQVADATGPSFQIVGIGASAGGVEAFSVLLQALPTDTGMAFVLILHLDPNQQSHLSAILARTTRMSVHEAQDGMVVEPNHVYVIPPNRRMTIGQGTIKLSLRENTGGKHLPVDAFFHSLAEQLGSKAIGVVLTGGDGDGSRGLEAIKEKGGITFAQDEQSSRVSSMPRSAVATGQVDFVLPLQQIAEALSRLAHQPGVPTANQPTEQAAQVVGSSEEVALQAVFKLLARASGADFSHYKRPMILRRIQRRMVLQHIEQMDAYVRYLKSDPAEVQALCREVLINVTDFFRDPEMFLTLGSTVFANLLSNRSPTAPIRIWVAGCSTGQEAYSLAIRLLEYLAEQDMEVPIQIFATDLSEQAIEQARTGIYRKSQLESVSPQRLQRFFAEVEGGYQVSPSVRATCVFARQNLASDPPFSQIDLVSCRNVLIYLMPDLQKRVLSALHFALRPGGYLWLGNSESVGDGSGFFTPVERTHKLYTRNTVPARLALGFLASPFDLALRGAEPRSKAPSELELKQEADRVAAERYLPPGLIVNSNLEIVEFRGQVGAYLEIAPGRASPSLTKMLSTRLQLEVRTAIHQASQQNAPVTKADILVGNYDKVRQITLEVIALKLPATERHFLVQFIETAVSAAPPVAAEPANQVTVPAEQEQQNSKLQQELALTREYLQTIIDAQEAGSQDLRIANEEVLSSNEELQSINEELQTAKEELQATNEELISINDEQQQRNVELALSSSDLVNLLTSTQIPMLILNHDLRIWRFTQPAAALLHLIDADVGRPLGDISPQLAVPDLNGQILAVITTLLPTVQEVQDRQGNWYEMRIRPYRTLDNKIEGAVLILQDIDALKSTARALEAAHQRTEAIVETVRESLLVLDADLRVLSANRAFYETFQVQPAQTMGRPIFELGSGQWNIPRLRTLLEEVLAQNSQIQDFEVEHDFKQVGYKELLLNASQLADTQMILLAITDVTHRKRLERERLASETSRVVAQEANRVKDEFLAMLSHELRTPLNPIIGWTQMLRKGRVPTAKQAEALEIIERNAQLQNQLIGDLLDISRIEQGKFHCSLRPEDLQPLVKAAVEAVLQSAETAGVELSVDADSPAMVMADPSRMQQVVWNLLTNAVKFTPRGGRVEVHLTVDSGQVRLVVRDTGIGIPASLLLKVFDCFRQTDSSTTRGQGGLGLGLFIVSHIVQMHKGRVRAQSEGEGKGATFTVELPTVDSWGNRLFEHLDKN